MFTDRLKAYLEAMPRIAKVWVNKDGIYHLTQPKSEGFTEYTRDAVLKPKKQKEDNA